MSHADGSAAVGDVSTTLTLRIIKRTVMSVEQRVDIVTSRGLYGIKFVILDM